MAYYQSLKNLLNNNKTFTEIYSRINTALNTAASNNITLNNSKDGFSIGDYILIELAAIANNSSSGTNIAYYYGVTISGIKLIFSDNITTKSSGNSECCGSFIAIGYILENNISINFGCNAAYSIINKVYRLSNNS